MLRNEEAYEHSIDKMKRIIDQGAKFDVLNQSRKENAQFMIVEANGRNFGQVLLISPKLQKMLGHSDSALAHLNILDLMPTPIKAKHPSFVKHFHKTGRQVVIG